MREVREDDVLDPRDVYRIGAGRGGFDAKAIFIACGNRLYRRTFRHRGGPTKIYSHFGLPTNKGPFVPPFCTIHGDTSCCCCRCSWRVVQYMRSRLATSRNKHGKEDFSFRSFVGIVFAKR